MTHPYIKVTYKNNKPSAHSQAESHKQDIGKGKAVHEGLCFTSKVTAQASGTSLRMVAGWPG